MDTDDLHQLGKHLEERGLHVAACEPELRLHVSNPLNARLAEEIRLAGGRYVTSFDYEIGDQGDERACAERIGNILAVAQHPGRRPT